MINSINNNSVQPAKRGQIVSQPQSLRNNPSVLNAIVQTQQRSSNAVAPVKILAVPQAPKSGSTNTSKLPRGSLVDVLA